jgi:hypothetical protein
MQLIKSLLPLLASSTLVASAAIAQPAKYARQGDIIVPVNANVPVNVNVQDDKLSQRDLVNAVVKDNDVNVKVPIETNVEDVRVLRSLADVSNVNTDVKVPGNVGVKNVHVTRGLIDINGGDTNVNGGNTDITMKERDASNSAAGVVDNLVQLTLIIVIDITNDIENLKREEAVASGPAGVSTSVYEKRYG